MNGGKRPDRPPQLKDVHLLLVEDDPLLLLELNIILTGAGALRVTTCRTVEQALAAAEAYEEISAAVLDVRIGRDSVFPVARRLASRGTPFVFYTGQLNNDEIMAEWPESQVLSKPASPMDIMAAVVEALKAASR